MRLSLLISLIMITACATDQTVSAETSPTDVWTLQTMDGMTVTTPITLQFPEPGRIAGRAPCNRYFGQQTAPLPWFKAGAIGATKMACPDLPLEAQYFDALSRATLAEIQGDILLLSTDDGPILAYRRAP